MLQEKRTLHRGSCGSFQGFEIAPKVLEWNLRFSHCKYLNKYSKKVFSHKTLKPWEQLLNLWTLLNIKTLRLLELNRMKKNLSTLH